MMGSADALPEEPSAKTVFVEDMTEEQLASAVRHTTFYIFDCYSYQDAFQKVASKCFKDLIVNIKMYVFSSERFYF